MPATGKVVGRLVTLIVDQDDPDQEPDLVPLAGKVTFQLNTARVTELDAQPVPVVIASTPLVAVLDQSGYLSTPDAAGGVQYQGIRLPANDDPNLNPTQTQYTVSYSLTVQGTNTQVSIPTHLLFLPSNGQVDLATMIPPVAAPLMSIAQSQALLALAVRTVNGVGPDPSGNVVVAGGGGGLNGESPELRTNGSMVQWKYPSESTWTNLFTVPSDGTDGTDGADGANGSPGTPGTPGSPGKSAYQVAVDNGFVGNESAWIASLKGAKGDQGNASTVPGPQGSSAYQVAVANGFVGTEATWLLSLKGADGTNGTNGTNGAKGDKGDPGDSLILGVLNPGQLPTGSTGFYIQRVS